MHKELPELARELKKMKVLVKLDTNGSKPEMIKKLIAEKLIDYIAMDIKAPFEKYEKITGTKTNISDLKESIKTIIKSGIEHEFRTTAVPGLVSRKDLIEMAKNIKGAKRLAIQQFSPQLGKLMDKQLESQKPYSREEMQEMAKECCKHVKTDAR